MKTRSCQGHVLVVSLVLLLAITTIGIASIGDVTINERVATNYRDSNLSFQAAEAALREGEIRAETLAVTHLWTNFINTCTGNDCFTPVCNNGLCFSGNYTSANSCTTVPPATPIWEIPSTWSSNGVAATVATNFPNLVESPKYIIEFMCFVPVDPDTNPNPTSNYPGVDWSYMYRVTGYSLGEGGSSTIAVQSTYKVDPI